VTRVLVLHAGAALDGAARTAVEATAALAARGHAVAVVAPPGAAVLGAVAPPVEAIGLGADGGRFRRAWRLRRVVQTRLADVLVVADDRSHGDAVRAARLAGRGAVVRRVPLGVPAAVPRAVWRRAPTVAAFAHERDATIARLTPAVGVAVIPPGTAAPPLPAPDGAAADGLAVIPAGAERAHGGGLLRAAALVATRRGVAVALCGPDDAAPLRLHAAALGLGALATTVPPAGWRAAVQRAAVAFVGAAGDDGVLAVLDAQAAGAIVVLERDGPLARLMTDGAGALVVAPHDPHQAAAAVAALLGASDGAAAAARAARREAATRWPWDATVAAWDAAVARAASGVPERAT
jgi:hypothetical protein